MKHGHLLGGTFLIAGTAIGGAVLALPVLTGAGGFFPSVLILLLCWLFMSTTAVLMMNVFLWSEKEVNIVSMARQTLGRYGAGVAWVLYLFLFYSLTIAYVSGGGGLVGDLFGREIGWLGPLLFVLVFAPFVTLGAHAVDRLNLILMSGLILSFLVFVFLGIPHIEIAHFVHHSWPLALLSTPVIFTSFGFQGIIPTVTQYLGRSPRRVRLAIWFGSTIPLLMYLVWEWLILGTIPLEGLLEAKKLGKSAVHPFRQIVAYPWLFRVVEAFAFFAIVTSFLGVTLGLLDFLADGLKVKKNLQGRCLLSLLIFLPPLIFSMLNPTVFLVALSFGGGLGCLLLLGLLPILMFWRGHYILGHPSTSRFVSRKEILSILLLFVFLELLILILF